MLSAFDYVAMGHIHKPQKIAEQDTMRYSGSPIPLSFSETNNQKSVVMVSFEGNQALVSTLKIPLFKKLYKLLGTFDEVKQDINKISDKENPPFVEVTLQGNDTLNYDVNEFVYQSNQNGVDILILKRENKIEDRVLDMEDESITLSELDPLDIFDKRLDSEKKLGIDEEMKEKLQSLYTEVLKECSNENN
jgi:exonuclease SbcD